MDQILGIKGSDSLIRYVTMMLENGERMVNIGHMESREATGVLRQAGSEYSEEDLAAANKQFA